MTAKPTTRDGYSSDQLDIVTVVKIVDFSYKLSSAIPEDPPSSDRRPNSSRRLRPGISPRNAELIPAQVTESERARADSEREARVAAEARIRELEERLQQ